MIAQLAPVQPWRPKPKMSVVDLVDGFRARGAFNGGRLAEACRLYEHVLSTNATVALTLSGAMVPAGMGGTLIELMERGFVDCIISTGANLYHDLHFALDMPVVQGDFRADDESLAKDGVVRIYDVFITEKVLLDTDLYIRKFVERLPGTEPLSTARLHRLLGEHVLEHAPHPELSFVAAAARLGVPVYTSSPGDSSIGMNLAGVKFDGGRLMIDPDLDVLETSAIVHAAEQNAVIMIGGGSPKNFYLQTQPTLWQILGVNKGGHDYFIQLTTDSPHWGGLSGATPQEAVSWGKVKPGQLKNNVVVYSCATVTAPVLFGYAVSRCKPRKPKRLGDQLDDILTGLRRATGSKRKPGAAGKGL
ncbi:MAG: deoxyhypusine synthase [Candidatus Wallbacteria bacterium]|nr:deoxyhypusine synthase [Candidatus Wallbacteria bacterium]